MVLTRDEVRDRVDRMHLDDLDLIIVRAGAGYAVTESRNAPYVCDIGSSYEVPDATDERGREAFTVGPWTAYQYHPSYVAPNVDNYDGALDDLAAGNISAVIVGCTDNPENDSWIFGIRVEQ